MDEKKQSIDSIDNNNEDQLEVPKKGRYPRSVAFIIGNEFCERFSYYGAKAILVIFFTQILRYNDDEATEYYHIFAMACYFTPVIGAIIADSLLGKFRTIFYISILYAIGNIVLSYASFEEERWITWIGLVCIALGTGGIKPCVSAFGGDQFGPGMEKQLQKFFSLFYISINAGSLLSTFITPILREDVQCFDQTSCYPLAFGVPAVLMCVALALFVLGRFLTNYVMIPPKKDSVVVQVVSCVFTSLSRKWFKRMPKRDHWLDYADDKFDATTIADIKAVMRVLFLYLPLPIFWALFDQQGSRWTLQATKMDGAIGGYRLKPDQIQVVNPILIILFIPVFEYGVYPLFAKFNFLKKPLQRIVCGGVLAAVAFTICGFFQLTIESELPPILNANEFHLTIANGLDTEITLTNPVLFPAESTKTIGKYNILVKQNVNSKDLPQELLYLDIAFTTTVGLCSSTEPPTKIRLDSSVEKGGVLYITEDICGEDKVLQTYNFDGKFDIMDKPADGGALTAVVFNFKGITDIPDKGANVEFRFTNSEFTKDFKPKHINDTGEQQYIGFVPYNELDIHLGGEYTLEFLKSPNDSQVKPDTIKKDLDLKQGGSYIIVAHYDNGKFDANVHNLVTPNSVSMFWQIIQYLVITAGEIMFSITGLEFSYSQAPASMKSVLQAAWLLTVAFGNLIIVIISSAKIFEYQHWDSGDGLAMRGAGSASASRGSLVLAQVFLFCSAVREWCSLIEKHTIHLKECSLLLWPCIPAHNTSNTCAKISYEFFFFGGLMVADMIVFAIMAYFYVPYQPFTGGTENNITFDANEEKKPYLNGNADKELNASTERNGISNDAFHEEDTKF
ncbi:unnamed protein product [Oppiella nova]|uniref:Oligopeptide transporter 1 n=1 Tax=Oppiella nova TaxID=334625 RepID=A0A7R9QHH9_9ACAR|nr:unnamed protein product [Oppiella nova]CAG2165479.1 unnamed protein product [Oppiella nova]